LLNRPRNYPVAGSKALDRWKRCEATSAVYSQPRPWGPVARTSRTPSKAPRAARRPYIKARAEKCLEAVLKFKAVLSQQLGAWCGLLALGCPWTCRRLLLGYRRWMRCEAASAGLENTPMAGSTKLRRDDAPFSGLGNWYLVVSSQPPLAGGTASCPRPGRSVCARSSAEYVTFTTFVSGGWSYCGGRTCVFLPPQQCSARVV
jgi:hypothetical protein